MDVTVSINFDIKNLIDDEELKELEMTFEEYAKMYIREEGICGVIDLENYEIVAITNRCATIHNNKYTAPQATPKSSKA